MLGCKAAPVARPAPDAPVADAPDPEGDDAASTRRPGFTVLRVLGVSAMLAIIIFWIWVFSGAPRKQNPDYLDDRAWVEAAEATCAPVQARVDERALGDELTNVERADAVDESTAELRAMLEDLSDPPPDSEADVEVVEKWLGDWETLLEDRDTYTAELREDPDARFITTEKFNDPIGTVIETFATTNEMPSCGEPGDVG